MYERRASPLHAARAGVALAWSLVLVSAALAFEHPLILAALTVAVIGAALAAGVGRRVARVLPFALPFALLIALINPLANRDGLTVIFRLGELPPFGQVDVTLESLAYGAVLGARAIVVLLAAALLTATVDPDEVLRLFRRVSFRSALTAALSVRLVPVLQRDGRRLAEARRCRAGEPPSHVAVLRAVATGALDRAGDVAATLELRGYRSGVRAQAVHRAWSRHDLAFAVSAVVITVAAVAAHVLDLAALTPFPSFEAELGAAEWTLAGVFVVAALLPFSDRRGVA